MTARKLVYYGLVVSPSLLLGFIGLGARAYKEPYDFEHFDNGQDACARSYVDLIRITNSLPSVLDNKTNIKAVRQVGQAWSKAVLTSQAKTIPVLDIDQSTSWVVCEEVTSAKARVSWSLWRIAQWSIENRDYDQAARDLAVSYVVNQATKGMNLFTIAQASKRQELVINRLTEISPYLSNQARVETKNLVARVRELDDDTTSRLRMARVCLKVACSDTENQASENASNQAYWTRLYDNSERSVSNLGKKWKAFRIMAGSQTSLTGPMPKNLIYKHEMRPAATSDQRYYTRHYPPHRIMFAYMSH